MAENPVDALVPMGVEENPQLRAYCDELVDATAAFATMPYEDAAKALGAAAASAVMAQRAEESQFLKAFSERYFREENLRSWVPPAPSTVDREAVDSIPLATKRERQFPGAAVIVEPSYQIGKYEQMLKRIRANPADYVLIMPERVRQSMAELGTIFHRTIEAAVDQVMNTGKLNRDTVFMFDGAYEIKAPEEHHEKPRRHRRSRSSLDEFLSRKADRDAAKGRRG